MADCSKPWAIVRILPGAQNQIIDRFCNRQDADDRARALRKFVRSGIFEVVFDRPQ
ncbi:MAG: DNA recombination protein RmuC [Microcoleus sp. SU_5_6]|nr:DNA recombination protein RmuC [Microcoleus sp. SU_5_6]NJL68390.1 DNA recombination protein RmuC [Microcoleus sp. SM1_3_4]